MLDLHEKIVERKRKALESSGTKLVEWEKKIEATKDEIERSRTTEGGTSALESQESGGGGESQALVESTIGADGMAENLQEAIDAANWEIVPGLAQTEEQEEREDHDSEYDESMDMDASPSDAQVASVMDDLCDIYY